MLWLERNLRLEAGSIKKSELKGYDNEVPVELHARKSPTSVVDNSCSIDNVPQELTRSSSTVMPRNYLKICLKDSSDMRLETIPAEP